MSRFNSPRARHPWSRGGSRVGIRGSATAAQIQYRCILIGLLVGIFAFGIKADTTTSAAQNHDHGGGDQAVSSAAADRRACLRCHAMTTLAYRNPDNGLIVDLSIDPQALAHSAHGEMACLDCHRRSYRRYPHPDRAAPREFDCVGCHRGEGEDLPHHWDGIDAEFQRSVHAISDAPEAADFSCHSCHDPHRFRMAAVGEPIRDIVSRHNAVCMSCHQDVIAPHTQSHDWLPNRDAHWGSVRCVDCHTPTVGHAHHEILPAAESAQNCVGCHSTTPQLLARLYRFRSEEDIARSGLLAKAIFNEAYVVGMSRSPTLDRISLIIMGLLVLLLTAHGIGRYLVHRARSRPE
jgi:hypothetical protein